MSSLASAQLVVRFGAGKVVSLLPSAKNSVKFTVLGLAFFFFRPPPMLPGESNLLSPTNTDTRVVNRHNRHKLYTVIH